MHRNRIALLSGVLMALLLIVAACGGTKEPASEPTATPTPQPPSDKWTPEPTPTKLDVESSADFFNKQGVLRPVYFETDKWDILPEARQSLKENAAWILAHPQFRLSVEGHCDERNTEAYNLALGERRANASKEYLIGLGVPAEKIQTVSYGKSRPADPSHTEEAWAKNRRDQFVLIDLQ